MCHVPSSVPEADAVLDDDVVEVRLHPQQHLPDEVNEREVFGVDRGGAAGAGREEERVVLLRRRRASPGTGREARSNVVRGRSPDGVQLPLPWAQITESTCALMMRPG